ncbi:hypothetical protein VTJ49DRAFT_3258 [Mycothermus thermophilus]|uniref:DUF3074 domain-containing protein n=1 Tax=Humicola insolens TaxID=85995 RepID=A0ABR3V805_HUMIN
MVVSRPCDHPDCPPRSSFVRGTYESVELVREVPVERPLRRVRSSIDLIRGDAWRTLKSTVAEGAESEGELHVEDTEMAIEWLMITRSDPGGSVPRFMVEKGTPGGIIGDADKFLTWLSSLTLDDLKKPSRESEEAKLTKESEPEKIPSQPPPDGEIDANSKVADFSDTIDSEGYHSSDDESFASAEEDLNSQPDDAYDKRVGSSTSHSTTRSAIPPSVSRATTASTTSTPPAAAATATAARLSRAHARHEKELQKLRERMRKAQEKVEKRAHARKQKHAGKHDKPHGEKKGGDKHSTGGEDSETDPALTRLQEKYARAVARQEDKFRRETERLLLPLANAQADKEKTKDNKNNPGNNNKSGKPAAASATGAAEAALSAGATTAVTLAEAAAIVVAAAERERDWARAERDAARKEADMFRERVGELQAQNTMLVARLGRLVLPEGVDVKRLLGEGGGN